MTFHRVFSDRLSVPGGFFIITIFSKPSLETIIVNIKKNGKKK